MWKRQQEAEEAREILEHTEEDEAAFQAAE